MDDQVGHEQAPGEKAPKTAILDLEEFSFRLMRVRIFERRWKTVPPMVEALAAYVAEHAECQRSISKESIYRMERGVKEPSVDELLLLDAVLRPKDGIAYLMPVKDQGVGHDEESPGHEDADR